MSLTHNFASVNGVRLHYASAGERGRPLIVFLHGFPEFWYAWRKLLPDFGSDYFAVAPDMRGYNLSDKPEGVAAYAVSELCADVFALADSLGYSVFHLVGHDWGGVVAWACAIKRPERIERLAILNAPHPGLFARELASNPRQIEASQYIALFRRPGSEAEVLRLGFIERALLRPCLASGAMTAAEADEYRKAWAIEGALTAALNYYRSSRFAPATEVRPAEPIDREKWRVRVPAVVIWGMNDRALMSSNLDGLSEVVDRLTVHRLEGASHWLVHEHPAKVAALLRDFLQTPL